MKLEKERNRLLRELPRLEDSVHEQFLAAKSDQPELAAVLRIEPENLDPMSFIRHCWDNFDIAKENEKVAQQLNVALSKNSDLRKIVKRPNVANPNLTDSSTSSNYERKMKRGRIDQSLKQLSIRRKIEMRSQLTRQQKTRRRSRSLPPRDRNVNPRSKLPTLMPVSYLPVLTERTPSKCRSAYDDLCSADVIKKSQTSDRDSCCDYEEFKKGIMPNISSTFIQFSSGTSKRNN